jgi:hypothetical protein
MTGLKRQKEEEKIDCEGRVVDGMKMRRLGRNLSGRLCMERIFDIGIFE